MTRNFRLGLFVSMAAALGLHVRPCWTCCWIPTLGSDESCDAGDSAAEAAAIAAGEIAPSQLLLTTAAVPIAASPEEGDAPELISAALAEAPATIQRTRRARPMLRKMWGVQSSPPGELGFPSAE